MRGYELLKRFVSCGVLTALLCAVGSVAIAQDVTAIEEEWQLDIDIPKADRSSPQLNLITAATGDGQSLHAILRINQHGAQGGGMELQLWNGTTLLASSDLGTTQSLATTGERITWTTRMDLSNNGVLTVKVLTGVSTTWGRFSGANNSPLTVSAPTGLKNLNSYDPNFTTNASGVEYGSNRVNKIMLRKVRVYTGNKKSVEQSLDRTIYQSL
jgi:hypothetical protein